ncbi:TetR/AcrR family transcriptional regulator [Bacillus sp. FJAT-45350]|uniref:TetR/AcrR family transcriptional regulator n=1 Tax=Bacillus sp. FJAT-45350 TaxID=2011014 RepID=UPI000BB89066|nr:TetR/AcrR family transcriptional regulator [Bacillus sp. FJAT-45350]
MKKRKVPASVKDPKLLEYRRNQIIKASVRLIKEKGYHRTTTREISKESGFSIGALYEYIGKKEDVLFLVCDYIYDEVNERLESNLDTTKLKGIERLKVVISSYFRVVDGLQDEIIIMYQDVKALPKDALLYVLNKNNLMMESIEKVIRECVAEKIIDLNEKQIKLTAHNIIISGHMWAFRRWALKELYTIDEYIDLQTDQLLLGLLRQNEK